MILYDIVTLNVGCGQRPLDTSEGDASLDEELYEDFKKLAVKGQFTITIANTSIMQHWRSRTCDYRVQSWRGEYREGDCTASQCHPLRLRYMLRAPTPLCRKKKRRT